MGTKLPGWFHREKMSYAPKEVAGDQRGALSSHKSLWVSAGRQASKWRPPEGERIITWVSSYAAFPLKWWKLVEFMGIKSVRKCCKQSWRLLLNGANKTTCFWRGLSYCVTWTVIFYLNVQQWFYEQWLGLLCMWNLIKHIIIIPLILCQKKP